MKPYNPTDPKSEQVRRMFDRIAPRYDLLNHLLSLGIDRGWRRRAVRAACAGRPAQVLDVATGTADMAIAIARALPEAKITGIDLSPEMIAVGQRKTAQKGLCGRIALQVGDASALPFADASFDAVSVAFGVRNFDDIARGIGEMRRVLRPGGRIVILEFSTPRNKMFAALYRFYFHRLLPRIGGALSVDARAYRYLPQSVDEFPAPSRVARIMEEQGFGQVAYQALTQGIACLYTAKNNG